ncbi:hypothetical protein DF047_16720 [Burkholderia cenocepacia]|uniref:hypothetical protein n=1 Tax=Burkholderia cenocepacia TaxID=95486 RepID=UPI000F5BFAE2|nr:hypothetical protein [Burkholderia cenocepacia]RQV07341.1 hypothetical protein DF047_16720 [Burkholderia cenocepacia]
MTTVCHDPGASGPHEVAPAAAGTAAHARARIDLRARLYRSSIFRHAARAWHPSHGAAHARQAAADHLRHLLAAHGGLSRTSHLPGRHDGHGGNGAPRPRQPTARPDPQQKHRQQQQQSRHPKTPPQTPKHERRPSRHPAHGSWTSRRDAAPGARMPSFNDGGSQSNGGRRDAPEDGKRRIDAIRRVAAAARTELQALAASIADQPLVYPDAMRDAVILQRCAGHDAFAVSTDVLKARQLAGDDASSSYDDLLRFLVDFKRLSAGTGARGALTPLLAFHDLRPSTAALRARSLVRLDAIARVRDGVAGRNEP